jgi:hypothetical protein
MLLLNGKSTNYFCDSNHPPHLPVSRPGAYVEYVKSLRMGASGGFSAPSFEFDFATGLDEFPETVLFIAGSCSALGPGFQRRYNMPLFRSAELVEIRDVGHRLFVENFPAVSSAVRSYLREYGN